MDRETLAFYDREPGRYAETVAELLPDGPPELRVFADALAPGSRVLDFGAGHGWAAAWLAAQGFAAEATDGSAGLAAEGKRRYGLDIRVAPFDALDAEAAYDGIWCSFALLHDTEEAFPGHIARLARALKPGGLLYLGMKEGEGTVRDRLGRRYFYIAEAALREALTAAGFEDPDIRRDAAKGLAGKVEPCLHAFARLKAAA